MHQKQRKAELQLSNGLQITVQRQHLQLSVQAIDLCLFQSISSSPFLQLRLTREFLSKTNFIQPVHPSEWIAPTALPCRVSKKSSLLSSNGKSNWQVPPAAASSDLLICPPHTDEALWRCRHFKSEGTHPSVSHFWVIWWEHTSSHVKNKRHHYPSLNGFWCHCICEYNLHN